MTDEPGRLLTITEAAAIAGVSRQRISAMVTQGHLLCVPGVSVRLVTESDLREWMARAPARNGRPVKSIREGECTCLRTDGTHHRKCAVFWRWYRARKAERAD